MSLDEAVPEEGADISGLNLELVRCGEEQGRASELFSSLRVTIFFVLCL